ncbi:MAG: MSMEG_0565 family glycosyltransferase [Thermoleophilia bacterium]|nr:MSMEG_0565 family glycosyltransferase [Thermoleophilia bacterium]
MHIRLLTYSTKPRGGVVHALNLAEALAARTHDVELWALSIDGAGFFRDPAVETVLVPVARSSQESTERRILRYADALAGALRTTPPAEVEHSEDCLSARALLTLRTENRAAAIVRTVHHVDEFRSPVLDACQRASISRVDHRVCVSRYWADRLREQFDVDAAIIPNGIDAARFRATGLSREDARARFGWSDRPVVLSVGGIEPRKGSRDLLAAFAALKRRRPSALLAIAGGETLFDYAEYRSGWHNDAERLSMVVGEVLDDTTDVHVMGRIDDSDMPALYRGADVMAMPSTREGFGLVALEAMAGGCPVVLSDLPVFREHFTPDLDCLMAPVGDSRRLSAACELILDDPAIRRRLTTAGRKTADRFTWGAAAAAHERLYEEIA